MGLNAKIFKAVLFHELQFDYIPLVEPSLLLIAVYCGSKCSADTKKS
jgi:hypothetical protein